jgi:hypothetical protein
MCSYYGTDAWSIHKGSCNYGELHWALWQHGSHPAARQFACLEQRQPSLLLSASTNQFACQGSLLSASLIWQLLSGQSKQTPTDPRLLLLALPLRLRAGYIWRDEPIGWDVAAMTDYHPDYPDSCG